MVDKSLVKYRFCDFIQGKPIFGVTILNLLVFFLAVPALTNMSVRSSLTNITFTYVPFRFSSVVGSSLFLAFGLKNEMSSVVAVSQALKR